jgi:hypothetical protein
MKTCCRSTQCYSQQQTPVVATGMMGDCHFSGALSVVPVLAVIAKVRSVSHDVAVHRKVLWS